MKASRIVLLLIFASGARINAAQPSSPFEPMDPMTPRPATLPEPRPEPRPMGPLSDLAQPSQPNFTATTPPYACQTNGTAYDCNANGPTCGCHQECCEQGGCEDCGGCCDPCHFRCGWYAGVAIVWAKPYFEHNIAYTEQSFGNDPNFEFKEIPLDYDFEATGRLWLGYENECGFGARLKYWEYDHHANSVELEGSNNPTYTVHSDLNGNRNVAFRAGSGDTMTITSSLELHVVDFELTQRYRWCRTEAQLGFGIRYLHMDQDYLANLQRDELDRDFLFHRHNFDGAGPTIALDLRRPIGCCGIAVLAGARAAVLVGSADEAFAYEYFPDDRETGVLTRSETEILACGEVMFGVEYKKELACCTELFVQCTLEGQIYHGAGNALDTTSDLGFLGLGFSFGVHR